MVFLKKIESNYFVGTIPFILIFLIGWVKILDFPLHDFSNSYFSAYLFIHGLLDISIFDPGKFNITIHSMGFPTIFLSFNPNPPSTPLLFAPFAFFAPFASKLIFTAIGIGCFSISLYRLAAHFKIPWGYLGIIPIIFYIPIMNTILYGQTYFIIFCLLAEGFLQLENKKRLGAGFFWTLAIFLKVFPVVVLGYLIIKREWRTVVCLLVCCFVLLAFCIGFQGVELWKYYVFTILPQSFNGQITTPFVVSYQSFYMVLKFLLVKDKFLNPYPMLDNVLLFIYLNYFLKALLLVTTYIILTKRSDFFGFGILFLTVILMLPYGSTYGNVLLIFIFINVLANKKLGSILWVSSGLFLISNLGVWHFASLPRVFQFPRLFLLIVLYLVLTINYLPKINWSWAILFFLPIIPWFIQLQQPTIKETELISTDDRPLLLDISFENGYLTYEYWGHQGLKSVKTGLKGKPENHKSIFIQNDQVYYEGKQLTFSQSHKKSPLVMNGNVVFLSDLGKGMGFYSIWAVPLN